MLDALLHIVLMGGMSLKAIVVATVLGLAAWVSLSALVWHLTGAWRGREIIVSVEEVE